MLSRHLWPIMNRRFGLILCGSRCGLRAFLLSCGIDDALAARAEVELSQERIKTRVNSQWIVKRISLNEQRKDIALRASLLEPRERLLDITQSNRGANELDCRNVFTCG